MIVTIRESLVQPAGLLDMTVLVCVLSGWHADQAEYV